IEADRAAQRQEQRHEQLGERIPRGGPAPARHRAGDIMIAERPAVPAVVEAGLQALDDGADMGPAEFIAQELEGIRHVEPTATLTVLWRDLEAVISPDLAERHDARITLHERPYLLQKTEDLRPRLVVEMDLVR